MVSVASALASSSNTARTSRAGFTTDRQRQHCTDSRATPTISIDKSHSSSHFLNKRHPSTFFIVKQRFMICRVRAGLQRRISGVAGVVILAGAKTCQNLDYKEVVNFRDNLVTRLSIVMTTLSSLFPNCQVYFRISHKIRIWNSTKCLIFRTRSPSLVD